MTELTERHIRHSASGSPHESSSNLMKFWEFHGAAIRFSLLPLALTVAFACWSIFLMTNYRIPFWSAGSDYTELSLSHGTGPTCGCKACRRRGGFQFLHPGIPLQFVSWITYGASARMKMRESWTRQTGPESVKVQIELAARVIPKATLSLMASKKSTRRRGGIDANVGPISRRTVEERVLTLPSSAFSNVLPSLLYDRRRPVAGSRRLYSVTVELDLCNVTVRTIRPAITQVAEISEVRDDVRPCPRRRIGLDRYRWECRFL